METVSCFTRQVSREARRQSTTASASCSRIHLPGAQGNTWWIGTHIEDVPPEELDRRAKEFQHQQAAAAEKTR